VTRVDEEGLRMRTMPLPAPIPIPLQPSIARAGDYFYFGSTDTVIREMLAVRGGKQPGLKSTDEFKRMASWIPEQGNSMVFVSQRFSRAISELQTKALAAAGAAGAGKATVLQGMFAQSADAFTFSVSANTADGWLTVGNGNSDPSRKALLTATMQPAAVVGLLAAIAIPNFVKARQTAQYNAIMNNLRMIEGAKEQWVLENKKSAGSKVTEQDITEYIRGGRIKPIAGETYNLNSVGTPATATLSQQIANHPAGSVIEAP
jgi:Tfp pilus assembly protein PilE